MWLGYYAYFLLILCNDIDAHCAYDVMDDAYTAIVPLNDCEFTL